MNFKPRPPLFNCAPAPSSHTALESHAEGCFQSTAYANLDAPKPMASALRSEPEEFLNHGMPASVFGMPGWIMVHSAHRRTAEVTAAVLPFALEHHLNLRDDAMKFDPPLSNTSRVNAFGAVPGSSPTNGDSALHCNHSSTSLPSTAPAPLSHLVLDSRAEVRFQSTAYPSSNEPSSSARFLQSTAARFRSHSAKAPIFGIRGWVIVHSEQCGAADVPGAGLGDSAQLRDAHWDIQVTNRIPEQGRLGAAGDSIEITAVKLR